MTDLLRMQEMAKFERRNPGAPEDKANRWKLDPQTVRDAEGNIDRKASIKANAKDIGAKWKDNFRWRVNGPGESALFNNNTSVAGFVLTVGAMFVVNGIVSLLRSPVAIAQTAKNLGDMGGHAVAQGFANAIESGEPIFPPHK